MLKILTDNVTRTAADKRIDPRRVVLVDHGSPIPEVTAVRRDLARRMREVLERDVQLEEAVMERRPGKEYDFNGELLEQVLRRLAREDRTQDVIISMLFMSAGRHAGAGGDVEQICRGVEREFPGFRVHPTALVGSHPSVIDILDSRYRQAI
jgi:sirohydrochlorin ferrochelatase